MGGYRINKKAPFTLTERRGKGGNITIITHTVNGFRTLTVSGKCKTPKGLSNSSYLYYSIHSIGYELLHQFPDLFKQGKNSTIFSFSLPAVEDRETKGGLRYSFQYTMNGGSNIETAITELLPIIPKINEKVTACTIQALEQACDP
jgi:hypothetical protein